MKFDQYLQSFHGYFKECEANSRVNTFVDQTMNICEGLLDEEAKLIISDMFLTSENANVGIII